MLKIASLCRKISVLILLGATIALTPIPAFSNQLNLDLATYTIRSKMVQAALGIKSIPIRAKSYTLPSLTLPMLKLQSVSPDQLNSQFREIFSLTSNGNFPSQRVRDLSDILTFKRGFKIYWINKASGAYTFSNNKEVMSIPTTIKDHRQALDLALKILARRNLVTLGPHETLDVEFVSQVMNAGVKDGETTPVIQYGSDYFVCLGRRYRGIPIIGSRLIIRLGARGKLFGVQKTWRPIVGEGEWVTTNPTPQGDQLPSLLLKKTGQANQQIIVHKTVSGYIEGPVKNEQLHMGLGCYINYTTSSSADIPSQKIIPLASVNFPLTGIRKSYAPVKVSRKKAMPLRDRDDRQEDERK